MKILKTILILSLVLMNLQCRNKSKFKNIEKPAAPLDSPSQKKQKPPAKTVSVEECDFYKIQSTIINCHEQRNFFGQTLPERKNIVASLCLKQAFSSVWGVNFNPSPYIYDPESVKNTNFHWQFSFGNIQKGSPTAFPPNSLELKYQTLLNQFKSSIDANQMNQCLGGNYPFADGPTIINTSLQMTNIGSLEPETFIRCYREQLEIYKAQKSCPF